jgi:aminopeptidase N
LFHRVKPSNYAISLSDLELGGSWTYQGKVDIDVEVKQETKEVTLNTHQLKIQSAQVSSEQGKTEGAIKASNITYDEKNQRATFHFDQPIPQSHKAVVSVKFSGIMNNDVSGSSQPERERMLTYLRS